MTVECPGGGPVRLAQDGAISPQHSSQLATRVEVHLVQGNSVHYNEMCICINTTTYYIILLLCLTYNSHWLTLVTLHFDWDKVIQI